MRKREEREEGEGRTIWTFFWTQLQLVVRVRFSRFALVVLVVVVVATVAAVRRSCSNRR